MGWLQLSQSVGSCGLVNARFACGSARRHSTLAQTRHAERMSTGDASISDLTGPRAAGEPEGCNIPDARKSPIPCNPDGNLRCRERPRDEGPLL
jgi:hypothetical protein